MKNKSVLITGGFGFIGKPLTEELSKKNCTITIFDKSNKIPKEFKSKKNLRIITGNCKEANLEKKIKGDFDFIFHFGAPSSIVQFKDKETSRLSDTIIGFLNIAKLGENKSVDKIVYPSSGSVYGYAKPPQKENSMLQTTNLYGVGKIACENIASVYNRIDSVGLRIFAGYGPGEDHKNHFASPLSLFLKSILKNEPPLIFGDGKQSRDFVYIDDMIKCIVTAAEKKTPKILNVGSGKSHTFLEVIDIINRQLKRNVNPKFVKKPVNYLENTQANITNLKKYLKIKPMNLEQGLKLYLKKINQ